MSEKLESDDVRFAANKKGSLVKLSLHFILAFHLLAIAFSLREYGKLSIMSQFLWVDDDGDDGGVDTFHRIADSAGLAFRKCRTSVPRLEGVKGTTREIVCLTTGLRLTQFVSTMELCTHPKVSYRIVWVFNWFPSVPLDDVCDFLKSYTDEDDDQTCLSSRLFFK